MKDWTGLKKNDGLTMTEGWVGSWRMTNDGPAQFTDVPITAKLANWKWYLTDIHDIVRSN